MAKMLMVTGVVIASVVAIWLTAALWPPRVNVDARIVDQRLVFHIKHNFRVNSIMAVSLWEEGAEDYLWSVDTDRGPFESIEYGELPRGATQRFPPNNVHPPPIQAGDVFYVHVAYQFDSALPPAACCGSNTYRFSVSEDSQVRRLELPADWTYP